MEKGVIAKVSTQSFDNTYQKLKSVIENNPNLKIIAELDHQANANNSGLTLNPTRLIMFGNPNLGTSLMQNSYTVGLDLPQKMLVHQNDEGEVNVSYNDPLYLQDRHGITENDDVLQKISGALDIISEAAISS